MDIYRYDLSEITSTQRSTLPQGMFVVEDGCFRVIALSDGLCELLKTTREKIVDEDNNLCLDIHPDDQAGYCEERIFTCLHPNLQHTFEFRVRRGDGHTMWLRRDVYPRVDGDYTVLFVSYTDVTAMHEAVAEKNTAAKPAAKSVTKPVKKSRAKKTPEKSLAEIADSVDLWQRVLNTAEVYIFWKDTKRRFLGANRAFLDFFGLPSVDAIRGKTDAEIGWNIELEEFHRNEELVLAGSSLVRRQGHCIARGQIRSVLVTKSPLRDKDGAIIGILGSIEDVTALRQAYGESERLAQTLDNVPTGICLYQMTIDSERCVMVNDYFHTLTGVKTKELLGQPCEALLSRLDPSDRVMMARNLKQLREKTDSFRCILRVHWQTPEDMAWVNVIGRRVSYASGERIYLSFTDMAAEQGAVQRETNLHILERALEMAHIAVWHYDFRTRRGKVIKGPSAEEPEWLRAWYKGELDPFNETLLASIDRRDTEKYYAFYRRVHAGESGSVDIRFCRLDGSLERCERITYVVFHDAQGQPSTAYGMAQRVTTEWQNMENYRHEMRSLSQASPVNLLAKGHANLIGDSVIDATFTNDMPVPFVVGRSFERVCRHLLRTFVAPEDVLRVQNFLNRHQLIASYWDGERRSRIRFRCRGISRRGVWAELTVSMFVPMSDRLEAFFYIYDVTRDVLGQNIINRLTDLGIDYIGMLDVKRERFYRCTRALEFSDTESAIPFLEFVRDRLEKHVPEDQRKNLLKAFSVQSLVQTLAKQTMAEYFYDFTESTGKKSRKRMQICYLGVSRSLIFFCRSDITAQHAHDMEQMIRLHEALDAAERANDAKTMFLASISHDMRTPLNGIMGYTNLALKSKEYDTREEYLRKIRHSGNLLLSLVNDTLELSRIESGKAILRPEDVELRALLDAVIGPIQVAADEKTICFMTEIEFDGHTTAYIDKSKLQEVMLNLLANAIKFTPERGRIDFSFLVHTSELDEHQGTVHITVRDTGVGISRGFLARVFEPFAQERMKETQKIGGTGLGLAIVKGIIDRMGGTIEVDSTLGEGTTFEVQVPMTFVDDVVQEGVTTEAAVDFNGMRILLFEDNYINMEIAKTVLEDRGIIVSTAENGQEGVDAFAASLPGTFDVILMDIRMPVMNGYEATQAIRKMSRPDALAVPILAMTADAYPEDVRRCLSVGMNAHIPKPIDADRLFDTLAKWRYRRANE